ncbi:MAG: fumarylacetoacetate hydrolase family protein [Blastocatellia bacterium]
MRIASFQFAESSLYGVVSEERVVAVSAELRQRFPTLQSVLECNALAEVATQLSDQSFALTEVNFLPVIAKPDKILCIGLNYQLHRLETGRAETEYPTIFARFANTLTAHNQPIVRPRASIKLDYEGELAVIIGKRGRHIAAADALSYVAGYTCFNDASVRDWQNHTSQFTPGKNFVATGGFGPWLVTTDELPDPTTLTLITRLNGAEMQRATTDQLIFDIPTLLAYISTFTELAPGDVIATGTPSGVGAKRNPPVFMQSGDVVEVEISGIGTLRNTIIQE